MVKIIFSDIDGTLINEELRITEKTIQAIVQKVEEGVYFVPVSARMPEAIKPIVDVLGVRYPIISYNGALVQDEQGEIITSNSLEGSLAYELCQYLEKEWPEVAWNVYSYGDWFSKDRENSWIAREERIVSLESKQIAKEKLQSLSGVHKLLLMAEPEQIDALEPILKRNYPQLSIAKSLPFYLEVMGQGIEKGQAVASLANHYQIDLEDAIAFGDNFNDLPMLEAVGLGIVMGNGPKLVQEKIGRVTLDHNHDGIAAVLEKM